MDKDTEVTAEMVIDERDPYRRTLLRSIKLVQAQLSLDESMVAASDVRLNAHADGMWRGCRLADRTMLNALVDYLNWADSIAGAPVVA